MLVGQDDEAGVGEGHTAVFVAGDFRVDAGELIGEQVLGVEETLAEHLIKPV